MTATTIAYILTPTDYSIDYRKPTLHYSYPDDDCSIRQPRDNCRATLLCAAYSRPMPTATNRNSGVAVKDKYNV